MQLHRLRWPKTAEGLTTTLLITKPVRCMQRKAEDRSWTGRQNDPVEGLVPSLEQSPCFPDYYKSFLSLTFEVNSSQQAL